MLRSCSQVHLEASWCRSGLIRGRCAAVDQRLMGLASIRGRCVLDAESICVDLESIPGRTAKTASVSQHVRGSASLVAGAAWSSRSPPLPEEVRLRRCCRHGAGAPGVHPDEGARAWAPLGLRLVNVPWNSVERPHRTSASLAGHQTDRASTQGLSPRSTSSRMRVGCGRGATQLLQKYARTCKGAREPPSLEHRALLPPILCVSCGSHGQPSAEKENRPRRLPAATLAGAPQSACPSQGRMGDDAIAESWGERAIGRTSGPHWGLLPPTCSSPREWTVRRCACASPPPAPIRFWTRWRLRSLHPRRRPDVRGVRDTPRCAKRCARASGLCPNAW